MLDFARRTAPVVLLLGLLLACAQERPPTAPAPATAVDTATALPTETAVPDSAFRVIAYVTAGVVPEVIPYERLTHIHYAFLIPNDDGTLAPFGNAWKLEKIVEEAHQAGVKVLISVGGWGWDEQFETVAADPALRARFVQNLQAFVEQYGLDGADVDWEYPDPGPSAQHFLALIRELRRALPGKLLTTAVVSHGAIGEGIAAQTFALFDYVNVMSYDGPEHGSMGQFRAGLDYWQGRGLPPAKTVLGVPFYARPTGTAYRKIVEADAQAAHSDTFDYQGTTIHYNGIPTIEAKTELALERAGGIMFWTLDHDAVGEHSLLQAIDGVVRAARSGS